MTSYGIDAQLLARFKRAAETLEEVAGDLSSPDTTVDQDTRDWLDVQGEPLAWHSPRGVTPDEYFFITTLYGNMNLEGQRTMIRKYFGPLFVQEAERNIRNFRPELQGYTGLRSDWMKDRLCKMGALLRSRGISMQEYVDGLRSLERKATAENPTPALDKIVADHQATGVKTLSVFVRDCVGGNCFPIDLRVRRQLERYQLPLDEKLLVRMCLTLGKNPRELARIFYEGGGEEVNAVDCVNLDELEPCVFYIWEGKGWSKDPCGKLIRQSDTLRFDVLDGDAVDSTCTMTLDQKDGFYHWRDRDGPGHWWGFLSETNTHTYLAGNYINPDGHQGVQIFIWPKS